MRTLAKSLCVRWPSVNARAGQILCVPTHNQVHNGMQNIIIENANNSDNKVLEKQARDLDQAISNVFWMIQQVKRDNCK